MIKITFLMTDTSMYNKSVDGDESTLKSVIDTTLKDVNKNRFLYLNERLVNMINVKQITFTVAK